MGQNGVSWAKHIVIWAKYFVPRVRKMLGIWALKGFFDMGQNVREHPSLILSFGPNRGDLGKEYILTWAKMVRELGPFFS